MYEHLLMMIRDPLFETPQVYFVLSFIFCYDWWVWGLLVKTFHSGYSCHQVFLFEPLKFSRIYNLRLLFNRSNCIPGIIIVKLASRFDFSQAFESLLHFNEYVTLLEWIFPLFVQWYLSQQRILRQKYAGLIRKNPSQILKMLLPLLKYLRKSIIKNRAKMLLSSYISTDLYLSLRLFIIILWWLQRLSHEKFRIPISRIRTLLLLLILAFCIISS